MSLLMLAYANGQCKLVYLSLHFFLVYFFIFFIFFIFITIPSLFSGTIFAEDSVGISLAYTETTLFLIQCELEIGAYKLF